MATSIVKGKSPQPPFSKGERPRVELLQRGKSVIHGSRFVTKGKSLQRLFSKIIVTHESVSLYGKRIWTSPLETYGYP